MWVKGSRPGALIGDERQFMEGINNSLTNGRLDPVHSGQGDPVVVRQDTEVQ